MYDRVHRHNGGLENYVYAIALAALLLLSLPANAFAVQVGCFVTAILLGFMFLLSMGITLVLKSQLCYRLGGALKTPWACILGLTVIELFLFVLVFAVTRTNFPVTLLIYLPFAAAANGLLLTRRLQPFVETAPMQKRLLLFALQALSMPAAIQVAGLVWSALTGVLESTEFHS